MSRLTLVPGPSDDIRHAPVAAGVNGLEALESLVQDCAASGVARRVLLLRADLLPVRLTRPLHLRLARAALDPLMTADRARAHDLPTGRMAVSWRGSAPVPLQQALGALDHLLGEGFQVDATAMQNLVRLFDLPQDGAALLTAAGRDDAAQLAPRRHRALPPAAPALVPLDTAALTAMERQLAPADLARFARRQPVCRLERARVNLA